MKKAMKLVSLVLAVVMLLGCLTACGSKSATTDATASTDTASNDTAAASDGGEIVIALISNTTGDYAQYGQPVRDGAMLYINQLNANGGINGKQVKVLEYDDKGDGVEAVNAYNLACDNGITAVFGATLTGTTIALADATYEDNMPQVTASATATGVTVIDPADPESEIRPNVFRACFIDPFQGRVMAEFADKTLGVKNVAILHDASSDYSKGLAEVFEKTLNEKGGKVVAKEAFLSKDIDFKAALTKIKAANPEAIYIPGYYEEVAKIIKQTREIGLNVPLIGCDGWDSPKLVEIAGPEALNNTYFSSAFSVQDQTESVQKFIADYKAMYQKDPDIFCMQGYNAGLVLADALKRAGDGADGTKLAAAIAATKDLPVASGKLTYDKDHNPIISAIIIEMKDGVQSFKEKISL